MMRRQFSVALVGAVLVATPRVALTQQFEGVIKQRTITVDRYALSDRGLDVTESNLDIPIERLLALRRELVASGEMTVVELEIQVKGHLIRTDVEDEEGPAYATMDVQSGAMRLVRPAERMYIEWSKEDLEQMRAYSGGGLSPAPAVRATEETRTINGMHATAYDVSTDGGASRIWVSTDDANLADAFRSYAERASVMNSMDDEEVDASLIVAKHGFPVLEQHLNYDSYEIVEVIGVERQSVSSDAFAPPVGYRKMTMAEMMGGMMQGGSPMETPGSRPAGLPVGGAPSGSSTWVEYQITGDVALEAREEDVVLCSESPDGLLARTLGEWIIDFEADGSGPGHYGVRITVTAPERYEALQGKERWVGNRLSGDGTVTVEDAGKDVTGFALLRVEFSASDLESGTGNRISLQGTMSCPVF